MTTPPVADWAIDLAGLFGAADGKDWQEQGLCAQTDPELFFPDKGGSTRDAKRVCQACPIRSQCLEYAFAHDERWGIWGGTSPRERRKLKKRADVMAESVERLVA